MTGTGTLGGGGHFVFERNGRLFGVTTALVAEVIEVPVMTRVPSVHRVIKGVINHHGDVLPVLDTGVLLGEEAPGAANGQGPEARIAFILSTAQGRLVVPIDDTRGLMTLPAEGTPGDGLIKMVVTQGSDVISVLDVERLVESVHLLVAGSWTDGKSFSAEHEEGKGKVT